MGRNYAQSTVDQLTAPVGTELVGDVPLFVTKALLESGVAYLGGYPGAPTSSLYDMQSSMYEPVLQPLGVQFMENSNEAAAAAMLAASVNNPTRGSVSWKVVGNNVAADPLAHVASSGVMGGVCIFVGEDYGLINTAIAERTLPYAQKSTIVLLDPEPEPQRLYDLVPVAFELSEASHLPVMYLLRSRVAMLTGSVRVAHANTRPRSSPLSRFARPNFDMANLPSPPYALDQETRKWSERVPAAQRFIREHGLNRTLGDQPARMGIITHGQVLASVTRAMALLGRPLEPECGVAVHCLTAVHPLVPDELVEFLAARDVVLIVEEGQPNLLEHQIRAVAQEHGLATRILGKDRIPMAGELSPTRLLRPMADFLDEAYPDGRRRTPTAEAIHRHQQEAASWLGHPVTRRSGGFCTGCPERPVFTAMRLYERQRGAPVPLIQDVGCFALGMEPPFHMGGPINGMGTSLATASPLSRMSSERIVSLMGDGTFWHIGAATSVTNALFNNDDGLLVLFENGWTSNTGQQANPGSRETSRGEPAPRMSIEHTLRGMGVKELEVVDPYKVRRTVRTLRKLYESPRHGLKVLIARGECELPKGRRRRTENAEAARAGRRVVEPKFGVDADVCTGDKSCMRLNGCPSLTLATNPNPLRRDPVTTIEHTCVGCGLCGEIAQAAALCPAFHEVRVVTNPTRFELIRDAVSRRLAGLLATRAA